MKRRLTLVSTGDELLSGRTLNSHPAIVTQAVAPLGLQLSRVLMVGDDVRDIRDAVSAAVETSAVVLVGGGLGPTPDDVTRQGVAEALGRSLHMDPELADRIRRRAAERGQPVPAILDRQAMVIEGARVLDNRVGSAPGQLVEAEETAVFLLPGPPAEFEAVFRDHVLPWLREHLASEGAVVERVLMTCGIPEVEIARSLEEAGLPVEGCSLSFRPAAGAVEVCFRAPGTLKERLEECTRKAGEVLGSCVYAEERIGLAEAVGRLLVREKRTVAVAESCTGGLLGALITEVSGSSRYFVGGIIAYSNEVKERHLGVAAEVLQKYGAVSAECAEAMAAGVRSRLSADVGVAITGIAGPTGGTAEKPVGLVFVAVADADGVLSVRRFFRGGRNTIRRWSAQTALDMVRRRLLGLEPEFRDRPLGSVGRG